MLATGEPLQVLTNFMSLESFSRLSQAIVNASETASQEAKTKAQKDAALVVNSVGSMIQPKRTVRATAFSEASDFLGGPIKAAREAKRTKVQDKKEAGTEQPAKSLAELLTETAAEDSE